MSAYGLSVDDSIPSDQNTTNVGTNGLASPQSSALVAEPDAEVVADSPVVSPAKTVLYTASPRLIEHVSNNDLLPSSLSVPDTALLSGPMMGGGPTGVYAGEHIALHVESSVQVPGPETPYIFVLGLLIVGLVHCDLSTT